MGSAHEEALACTAYAPSTTLVRRVVMGHSSRPECAASAGASDARGCGPGTNLTGPWRLAEMSIASRFHVSICIGAICRWVGESTTIA